MKSQTTRHIPRWRRSVTLIVALTAAALGLNSLPATAAPTPKPGTFRVSWTEPANVNYKELHTKLPGLPQSFADTDDKLHYYYMVSADGVWHGAYCIDITNHTAPWDATVSTTPQRNLDAEQLALMKYIVAQGPDVVDPTNDAVARSYSATQIAVWLVSEKFHHDQDILNLVLFPAEGDYSDSEGFAQTLEIGRLARSYLNHALARHGGQTLDTQPSFTSDDPATAPTHTIPNGAGTIDLLDKTGNLGDNWAAGRLVVDDAAGLNITVSGNKMTVAGTPTGDGLVTLASVEAVGSPEYLTESTFQEMMRFVFAGNETKKYYFRVHDSTPPSTPPTPSEPSSPGPKPSVTPKRPMPTPIAVPSEPSFDLRTPGPELAQTGAEGTLWVLVVSLVTAGAGGGLLFLCRRRIR